MRANPTCAHRHAAEQRRSRTVAGVGLGPAFTWTPTLWMEVRRRPPTARAGKVRELRDRVRTRLRRRAKADHVVRARGGGGQYHGAHLAWTRPPYRDSQGRGSLSRSRTTAPSCSKWLPAQSCAAGESSSVWPPIVSVRSAEAGRRSPRLPSSTLTLGRLSCGHDTLRHARPWSSISEVRSQHSGDRDALCSFRSSRGMLSVVGVPSLRTSRPELQPLRPQRLTALLPRERSESLTSEAI